MRKLNWPTVLLFLFIACKKNSSDPPVTGQNTKTIIGQWTWFKSVSVISTVTPQSSGHFWGLKFNSDSSCVQTGDLFPGGFGTYSLGYTTAPMAAGPSLKVTLSLYTQNYIYTLKSSDTLEMYDPIAPPAVDGAVYSFVKK